MLAEIKILLLLAAILTTAHVFSDRQDETRKKQFKNNCKK